MNSLSKYGAKQGIKIHKYNKISALIAIKKYTIDFAG
jgi:hypothetical protein